MTQIDEVIPEGTVIEVSSQRVTVPGYGDMTADVAAELALIERQNNARAHREALRRQRHIAATCGQETTIGKDGFRLVAQIDEEVYNYWEQREGREFWKHEMPFMLKRHPELAVRAKSKNATVIVDGLGRPLTVSTPVAADPSSVVSPPSSGGESLPK